MQVGIEPTALTKARLRRVHLIKIIVAMKAEVRLPAIFFIFFYFRLHLLIFNHSRCNFHIDLRLKSKIENSLAFPITSNLSV